MIALAVANLNANLFKNFQKVDEGKNLEELLHLEKKCMYVKGDCMS